jgi:hypothetical protein
MLYDGTYYFEMKLTKLLCSIAGLVNFSRAIVMMRPNPSLAQGFVTYHYGCAKKFIKLSMLHNSLAKGCEVYSLRRHEVNLKRAWEKIYLFDLGQMNEAYKNFYVEVFDRANEVRRGKFGTNLTRRNLSNEVDHKIPKQIWMWKSWSNGAESSDWSQDLERIMQRSGRSTHRKSKKRRSLQAETKLRAKRNERTRADECCVREIWWSKTASVRKISHAREKFLRIFRRRVHDR